MDHGLPLNPGPSDVASNRSDEPTTIMAKPDSPAYADTPNPMSTALPRKATLLDMHWLWSSGWHDIGLPVIVAYLTTKVVGRVERQKLDRDEAWRSRTQLRDDLLRLEKLATKLLAIQPEDGMSAVVRTSLMTERDRWLQRIDDISMRLSDEGEDAALTYINSVMNTPGVVIRCIANVRMVWLSERTESRKLELINGIAAGLRSLLFLGKIATARNMQTNHAKLMALLNEIDGQVTDPMRVEWLDKVRQRVRRRTPTAVDQQPSGSSNGTA